MQTVGSKGAGELQFHTPWSVCETISGYIAVADIHNDCGDCGAGRGGPVGAGAGAGRSDSGGHCDSGRDSSCDCDSGGHCCGGSDGHWGGPGSDDGDRTAAVAAAAAAAATGAAVVAVAARPRPLPQPRRRRLRQQGGAAAFTWHLGL